MALFKISKGKSSNLGVQPLNEGYAWFTPDDGKFYIDAFVDKVVDNKQQNVLSRVPLNAECADNDGQGQNIKDTYSILYVSFGENANGLYANKTYAEVLEAYNKGMHIKGTFLFGNELLLGDMTVYQINKSYFVFSVIGIYNGEHITVGNVLLHSDDTVTLIQKIALPWDVKINGKSWVSSSGAYTEEITLVPKDIQAIRNACTVEEVTANSVPVFDGSDYPSLKEQSRVYIVDGKMGIGTSTPTKELSVAGSAQVNQNLEVAGSGKISGDLTIEANVICETPPSESKHLTNRKYVDGVASAAATSLANGTFDLPYIKRVNGSGSGTTSLENIKVSGTITAENGESNSAELKATNKGFVIDSKSGTEGKNIILGVTSGSKVGIGTEDPSATLTVMGNTKVNTDLEVGGDASIEGTVTVATKVICATAPAEGSELTNKTYVDTQDTTLKTGLVNGTIDLPYVKRTNGAGTGVHSFQGVKIGPNAASNTQFGTSAGNAILNAKSVSANTDYISLFVSGGNTTRPLIINADANGTGNVGIGTTSPSTKLDVAGTITSTGLIINDACGEQDQDPSEPLHLANKRYVDRTFSANDAMLFKGVINSESEIDFPYEVGWTYKVGTRGSYVGQWCEPGDTIYCVASTIEQVIDKGTINSSSEIVVPYEVGWTYKIGTAGTYAGKTCAVGDAVYCTQTSSTLDNSHWQLLQRSITASDFQVLENNNENVVIRGAGTPAGAVGSETQPVYVDANGVVQLTKNFSDYWCLTSNNTYGATGFTTSIAKSAAFTWNEMDENKAATYMVSLVGNQTSQGLAKTPFNVDYGNGIASADAATKTGFYYINIGDSSRPSFKQVDGAVQGDYRVLTTAHSDNWLQQIATDFRSNDVFVRRKQNGSWIDWTPIVKMQQGADACPIPDASNNAINYLPRFDQTRNATIVPSNLKIKTGSSADEIYGATVSDSSDNSTLITKGYAMSKYIAVLNSTPNAVARYADNAGQLADSTVLINDAGNVSATSYTVNEDCTLEYSDTTGCLTFVFAS